MLVRVGAARHGERRTNIQFKRGSEANRRTELAREDMRRGSELEANPLLESERVLEPLCSLLLSRMFLMVCAILAEK